jgi:hypothetical protein
MTTSTTLLPNADHLAQQKIPLKSRELLICERKKDLQERIAEKGKEILYYSIKIYKRTPDKNLMTALHYAARKMDVSSLRKLLDFDPDVTVLDPQGQIPLHCLVEASWNLGSIDEALKTNVIQRLIALSKSVINVKNCKGNTPLYVAMKSLGNSSDHKELRQMVDLLLQAGADPNLPNNKDYLPLDAFRFCYYKRSKEHLAQDYDQQFQKHIIESSLGPIDKMKEFDQKMIPLILKIDQKIGYWFFIKQKGLVTVSLELIQT